MVVTRWCILNISIKNNGYSSYQGVDVGRRWNSGLTSLYHKKIISQIVGSSKIFISIFDTFLILGKCWYSRKPLGPMSNTIQCDLNATIHFFKLFSQITQISCFDVNRSPPGCTQYRFGSISGVINSFNYANLYQLANQQQTICFRWLNQSNFFCWK